METTIVYWGYNGIMEKKLETTVNPKSDTPNSLPKKLNLDRHQDRSEHILWEDLRTQLSRSAKRHFAPELLGVEVFWLWVSGLRVNAIAGIRV